MGFLLGREDIRITMMLYMIFLLHLYLQPSSFPAPSLFSHAGFSSITCAGDITLMEAMVLAIGTTVVLSWRASRSGLGYGGWELEIVVYVGRCWEQVVSHQVVVRWHTGIKKSNCDDDNNYTILKADDDNFPRRKRGSWTEHSLVPFS